MTRHDTRSTSSAGATAVAGVSAGMTARAAAGRVRQVLHSRARMGDVARVMSMRSMALVGNICCGLLTAAYLGPYGRGEQAALVVPSLVLAALSTLGLHASLIYNLRADPQRASHYLGAAMVMTFMAGSVSAGTAYFVLPYWLDHYGHSTVAQARLFLLSVPIAVVTPLLSGVLEANGRFAQASRVLYVQSLATLVILVALIALHVLTPFLSSIAYVCPGMVAFIYFLWKATGLLRPTFRGAAPLVLRLLHFGLRFYGVDILGVFSGYMDQIIIVYLLSPAATGAYAVALSVSRMLTVFQGSLSVVLFPSIAGRETSVIIEMVGRATRISMVVNAVAAVVIALSAPSLLLLGYGHRFAPAVQPFLILLAEAVVSSTGRTLAQSFSGSGRPSAVTAMELAGVACSAAAMLILIPRYGLNGAAAGALIGGIGRLVCVLCSFRLVLSARLPPLLVNRADLSWVAGR